MRMNAAGGGRFSHRKQGIAASISIAVALGWGAACGNDDSGKDGSSRAGRSGTEVDLDPSQIPDPDGDAPATGGAGGGPTTEDPPEVERPPPSLPARDVAAFDREARETTPRAADARGLGGACQSTADCRMGLGCASAVYSGVGQPYIAGGYCSRWCEQDAACSALAPGAICEVEYLGSALNLCLLPCVTGEGDAAEKCGGRSDLSCSVGRAPGIEASCLPSCTGSADCPIGYCSSGTGLCETAALGPKDPPGTACTVGGTSCNGFCRASSTSSTSGVCTGFCRLGSSCGPGGTTCAAEYLGLREGDGGICEVACNTSEDCSAGHTACAPTGLLDAAGEPLKGCAPIYAQPASLAPQRLSVEQLSLAALPSGVINVSTSSIFEALSHRLTVEDGAVCVAGDVIGEFGAVLDLTFQLRANNGSPFAASGLSAFTFEAEGPHVVRFDVYTPGRSFRYLSDVNTAGDIGEGPQRIGTDQLFDIFAGDAPFTSLEAAELEALAFSLILEDGAGSFRFCLKNLALETAQ